MSQNRFDVLATKLRARHRPYIVTNRVHTPDGEPTDELEDFEVCMNDGQAWPCFTEQTIRECENG